MGERGSVLLKVMDQFSDAMHAASRALLLLDQVINSHLALAWLVFADGSLTSCCIAYCCVLSSSSPFGLKKTHKEAEIDFCWDDLR